MARLRSTQRRAHPSEIDDTVLTASEADVAQMEFRLNKQWLTGVFALMLLVLLMLGVRVGYLALVRGTAYAQRALENSVRRTIIPAPRGLILDRYGVPLVENVPQTDVVVSLERTAGVGAPVDTALLATLLGRDRQALAATIAQARAEHRSGVVVAQNIAQEERFALLEHARALPQVRLVTTPRRHYIDSVLFAHVLGYTGIVQAADLERDSSYYLTDHVGRTGLERQYEALLRGTHGTVGVQVDARGRRQRTVENTPPVPGNDLYLAIDAELQKEAIAVMERAFERYGITRGALVALDPRDGSVRALVSLPSYDNNLFIGGITQENYAALTAHPDRPLFNRAIGGAYPPGSTVKPMLAGAALTEGVITEQTTVTSTGSIRVGRTVFHDWRVNGTADVRRAIATSHDIFFYAVGGGYGGIKGLGMEKMHAYYTRFGFGAKTGIDLPGEARGFVPTPAWKERTLGEKWSIGNDYHAAIGQGFVTATPLQVANATAAIANGGTLWQPHVLAYWRDTNGTITSYKPRKIRDHLYTPAVMRVVREGMRMTVTAGTARILQDVPVPVAAKTGTAQFGSGTRTHSWMTAFAPYAQPELVVTVLMEGQDEHTSSASAPVAHDVLTWYFTHRTTSAPSQDVL